MMINRDGILFEKNLLRLKIKNGAIDPVRKNENAESSDDQFLHVHCAIHRCL